MGSADAVVAYFDDLLARGVRENPDGSNCCEVTKEFGPIGGVKCYAWCCATASLSLKHAGVPGFSTASVGGAISDAKKAKNGLLWVPADQPCQRGDFATWDSGISTGHPGDWSHFHINCVKNPDVQSRFFAIGGNQSNAVTQGWYSRTNLQGFIRPKYDGISLPPGDEDMNQDQNAALGRVDARVGNLEKWADRFDEDIVPLIVDAVVKKIPAGGGATAQQIADLIAERLKA
jgi:hypothetical protein